MMEWMGALLLMGLYVFLAAYWHRIPEAVPLHFNGAGEIDRWGGRGNVLLTPVTGTMLYALLTGIGFVPAAWNTGFDKPKPENRQRVYTLTRSLLLVMKLLLTAMFAFTTVHVAMARPMPAVFLPVTLAAVFGSLIYYIVRILRANR